jgi:hypothetical protein
MVREWDRVGSGLRFSMSRGSCHVLELECQMRLGAEGAGVAAAAADQGSFMQH